METLEITGKKEGRHLIFERKGVVLKFDFKDKTFEKIRGDRNRFVSTSSAQEFFRGIPYDQVSDAFTDRNYALFIRTIQKAENRCTNVATLLDRIEDYAHLENYILLGIKFQSYNTFTKPSTIYPKEVIKFMQDSGVTFGYQNAFERRFVAFPDMVTNLCRHVQRKHFMDLQVYRMLHYLIVDDTDWERFMTMTATAPCQIGQDWYGRPKMTERFYSYEYKTVFDYLVKVDRREATRFDSALGYLIDYCKMVRDMNRTNADRYPKYLEVIHNIVSRNYGNWKQTYDDEIFKTKVNFDLEYQWSKYCIIAPKVSQDIKDEGTTLNHCVASYIDKVMDGTTQILFMREVDNKDVSLVTVEVRNHSIIQAKGQNNRNLTSGEGKWLNTYAKQKGLLF
jgi:hypothetical protein